MPEETREKYADVYVGYPVESTYTYAVPAGMDIHPGMRGRVNFRNRNVTAFVHNVRCAEPVDYELKDILDIIDPFPIFDSRLIDLAVQTASHYVCAVGEVLSMALPSGKSARHRFKNPVVQRIHKEIELTAEQNKIYQDIIISQESGRLLHLLFGITGSGKTELYIALAKYIIQQGRSVIYLVPEISLSSQIYERVYGVFGDEMIIYHSGLTPNQRLNNWKRFYDGEAKIAVGTRSAVYLQSPNPGLIIIDEEHDGSYKEGRTPRYNARRIAAFRARSEKSILVLGSATPSVESLYAAEKGFFRLHLMKERYGGARLPEIEIVKINPGKPNDMLSPVLRLYSKRAIDSGNQVIYLLNRRGFSPLVICNECGEVVECTDCSISMNYHRDGLMYCHYCGFQRALPGSCEKCGSDDMIRLGAGTQRLEEIIQEVFGEPRIFRLDQDTSRKKNMVFELIERMNNGEIDILLGTQMVAKGFDFHRVSTVGIIMADIGMNLPDFRSSERIFSLLIQVAGRCGRGAVPGKVVVQTLNEDNMMFDFLKRHDYYGYYKYELSVRKQLDYPPFSRIARLLVRGRDEDRVAESINAFKTAIDREIGRRDMKIRVLGPTQAPIFKIAGNFRQHMLLKSRDLSSMRELVSAVKNSINGKGIYLEIDIDPYDML